MGRRRLQIPSARALRGIRNFAQQPRRVYSTPGREPNGGFLVHDLAYYWPQYTPVTSPPDHDITLFTVSKSTGHAGIRIGWALVKDAEVARKMTKFIELSSLGVSKDSQLRATKIMEVVSADAEEESKRVSSLFEFGLKNMKRRWKMLRAAVKKSGGMFSLPDYRSEFCSFNGRSMSNQPGNLIYRKLGQLMALEAGRWA